MLLNFQKFVKVFWVICDPLVVSPVKGVLFPPGPASPSFLTANWLVKTGNFNF